MVFINNGTARNRLYPSTKAMKFYWLAFAVQTLEVSTTKNISRLTNGK